MLNLIWPIFMIVAIIYAFFSGRIEDVNASLFSSAEDAIELIMMLLGTICLWNGIMQIANETTLIEKLSKLLSPLMKILFPTIKRDDQEYKEISMNMVANIVGLGNAATPLGLKAMKTMQEKNPDKNRLTNTMAMLIAVNTASLQIIPTTTIAIRTSLGSEDPTSIIVPVWIATLAAFLTVVILSKILSRKF